MEKISDLLESRPARGKFRDQLFWIVDIINACKESNNRVLIEEAKLMEKALVDLQNFLETGNEKNLAIATTKVELFARIVKAAVYGDKKLLGFNIFLSYSTEDADYFRIKDIAQKLEEHPDITKVYYWEKDSGRISLNTWKPI